MNCTVSPTTYSRPSRVRPSVFAESRSASPGTFRPRLFIPRTTDECDRLLESAKSVMRMPMAEIRRDLVSELARFLGARSSVWTTNRRETLSGLIASAGEDAIGPVLETVARTPRAEIADDAEAVLTIIVRRSHSVLNAFLVHLDRILPSAVRAVLIRTLFQVGKQVDQNLFETALNDDDAEVRDAAAIAIGQLGLGQAKVALERRLKREKNPVVIDSIQTAIDELTTV